MSGGSYDYAYGHLENFFIEEFEKNLNDDPLRIAFLAHIKNVARAMHDIEWVDSGDYGKNGDHKAILACLHPEPLDATVRARLLELSNNLRELASQ
jgi:hypothetical protein